MNHPHQKADRDDVGNGILLSNLMEMNLLHFHAVRVAFSLCQQAVDLLRIRLHGIRKVQAPDHIVNLSQGMVVVRVDMCMSMIRHIRLLAAIHKDCHVRSGDAALL